MKIAACVLFAEAAKPCFLWQREKDVLYYEWPQGFLNVLETQRVCPIKHRPLMQLLFVLLPLNFHQSTRETTTHCKTNMEAAFSLYFLKQSCLSSRSSLTDL